MTHGSRDAWSLVYDLEPNIFPSGPSSMNSMDVFCKMSFSVDLSGLIDFCLHFEYIVYFSVIAELISSAYKFANFVFNPFLTIH